MFKEFNWGPALFLIIYQVLLLVSLPFYFTFNFPSIWMWAATITLLYLTGLSITAGYHRYFSHRSYKTNPFMETILLFFGSMSVQGSALRWSFEHRLHHAHVDTDEDPYSIKKGFWYAHFLWLMEKPANIDPKIVPDLMKNPRIMFQDRYYGTCAIASNVAVFLLVGWLLNDFWGAFFLASWTRIFLLHHFTWFINSLAHTWGDKPFCQEQSAVNNYVISLLTFGEGYHNYHHVFANDYRNGIRWYHFDPTKWLIWTLSKLGLVHHLKQMDPSVIAKRMVMERKNLLLDRIHQLWYVKSEELADKVNEISERIVAELARFNQLKEHYRKLQREQVEPSTLDNLKSEISRMKKNLKADWKLWVELSRNIMRLKPLPTL
ncbi:MAG: fatty acid desaturase [Parachlamydia sp.]|nr:fatty acid desaturase [Parachlamydia sp.]